MTHTLDLLQAIAAVIGVLAVAYGLVLWIARWGDHGPIEFDNARERARIAEESARNFQLGMEAWQSRIESMEETLTSIKSELGAAILYIVDLCVYLKQSGRHEDVPPIPDALRDLIQEGIRQRGGSPQSSEGSSWSK